MVWSKVFFFFFIAWCTFKIDITAQHTAVCTLGVCFKDRQVMENLRHGLGYECVQSVK